MYVFLRAHSVVTDWEPTDWSLPGSSIHGIFQQEYWSGFSFPAPGDLFHPGMDPASPASPAPAGGFFTTALPGKLGKPRGIFSNQKEKKKEIKKEISSLVG